MKSGCHYCKPPNYDESVSGFVDLFFPCVYAMQFHITLEDGLIASLPSHNLKALIHNSNLVVLLSEIIPYDYI